MDVQALEEVKLLAHQTTDTAGRLDELIEAVETATAERDLARKQLLVSSPTWSCWTQELSECSRFPVCRSVVSLREVELQN